MKIIRLLILLAIQIVVLNQIHLFGYVTPLFVGYMLLGFQKDTSRISFLLWGFVTGLLFDIFSNTAGMAAAACTLQAMIQPRLMKLFIPRDVSESFVITIGIGTFRYWTYSLLSMFVLHAAFYLLDSLTLHDLHLTLLSIFGSTIFASLLCVVAELIIRRNKK